MRTSPRSIRLLAAPLLLGLLALTACGSESTPVRSTAAPLDNTVAAPVDDTITGSDADNRAAFFARMDAIQEQVTVWTSASSIEEAVAAAEAAANLVVGPVGPGYGDRDGNGVIAGESPTGLLPGLDGSLAGIAEPLAQITCVTRDVLGSTAEDPAAGWAEMDAAIADWRPDNNTMPTLASHPMRIVGWATFTLRSDSLDEAHEYAGHAQLHVDVALQALDC